MQDGIIKGNGNSRYLKSVPSFLTLYPTYEAFAEALVAGTLPIDLNGLNDAGWTQKGTSLNKASLLTDTTAEAYGLDENATPDEALQILSRLQNKAGNDYVWLQEKREKVITEDVSEFDDQIFFAVSSGINSTIYSSTSYTVDEATGIYTLENPTTFVAYSQSMFSTYGQQFAGRYYISNQTTVPDNNGNISVAAKTGKNLIYIPPDATISGGTKTINSTSYSILSASALTVKNNYQRTFNVLESTFLNSKDSDTYPPEVDDGYIYTDFGKLGDKVRVKEFTYIGIGLSGVDNPITLHVGEDCKILMMLYRKNLADNTITPYYGISSYHKMFVYLPAGSAEYSTTIGFYYSTSSKVVMAKFRDGDYIFYHGDNYLNKEGYEHHVLAIYF